MIQNILIVFNVWFDMIIQSKGSGGKPSGTGKPSGGDRDNNPPHK